MGTLIKPKIISRYLNFFRKKPTSFYMASNTMHSNIFKINYCRSKFLIVPPLMMNSVCFAKKGQGKNKGAKPKKVQVTDEELNEVIDVEDYRSQLLQVQEKLKKDFVQNLSLRSSFNVESLVVKFGDEEYPLHELAQISRKNQNLIAINMGDFPEALKPAIQAINDTGVGINPQQDGTMIYLTIPKITREHRENLAKGAKSLFICAKDEIRNIQNNFIRDAKRKTDLSEDLIFNATNQIQTIAEKNASELESILKIKQKELLGET